jgi:uncharacterized phage infection (PIP) family protein YhgE
MSAATSAEGRARLREPRTWLVPTTLILGVAVALPAIYLSATSDPQGNLAGLEVAVVVDGTPGSDAPSQLLAGSLTSAAQDDFAFVAMTEAEADAAMADNEIAGAVVIPANFDSDLASLAPGSAAPTVPTVTILTNAGDGGLSGGLVINGITPMLRAASLEMGATMLAAVGDVTPANAALLSDPFRVASAPHTALPAHSGLGTSAFYFSLALVLIAFIGASLVGPIVDGALGFQPGEVGPFVQRRPYASASRLRTFLTKAGILAAASPIAAAAAVAVAYVAGLRASGPFALWLFSTLGISAVGVSALAVFAALGSLGAIVNTLFFVALALASSGGIVPLAATPQFFSTISAIAPFHYIVAGVRSLLYFGGSTTAGLGTAWLALAIGGATALALGSLVATLYGRVPAFSRTPRH